MANDRVEIIDERRFQELKPRLESLGIVKSDPIEYRAAGIWEVDSAYISAKRFAEKEVLSRAADAGAKYVRLMPFKSKAGLVTGTEKAVGEIYR